MHPIINIAVSAARAASKIVIRSLEQVESNRLNAKTCKEFTVEVENAATQEAVNIIHKAYPDHQIASEEHNNISDEIPLWIVDAIDGKINYAHAIPHFSVSIAVKHKGIIQQAVVYDPIRQELFTAVRGEGANLKNHRIRVSQNKILEESLLGTGFPHKEEQHLISYVKSFTALFPKTDGVRRSGSSALDLAYVAAGRIDGFWEFSLKEWNMAAGILLVQEAGGIVSDFQGEENYLENGNIIASNPKIYKAILQTIQDSLKE